MAVVFGRTAARRLAILDGLHFCMFATEVSIMRRVWLVIGVVSIPGDV